MNSIIEAQETLRNEIFKIMYSEIYNRLEDELKKSYLLVGEKSTQREALKKVYKLQRM